MPEYRAIAISLLMKKYLTLVILSAAAIVLSLSPAGDSITRQATEAFYRVKDKMPVAWPNVAFDTANPAELGLDQQALEELSASLAERRTRAFLIVRNGKLAHEYYAPDRHVNDRFHIAAMGKSITAAMLVALLVQDGKLRLDEPLMRHIPAWQDDPVRSVISARHILTHSSGIEDVIFTGDQPGWKSIYLENPDERFEIAMNEAPIIFPPGERYDYSGVGYYTLAYAMGGMLRDSEYDNVSELLDNRLMRPLGIPQRDWQISYAESYLVDGMELEAIGSGGQYSARAVARIGQLILNRGIWNGEQLLPAVFVDQIIRYGESPKVPDVGSANPPAGFGVWLNCNGFWPDMPRDMAVSAGANHQLMIIIPSLDLVLVRFGKGLSEDRWEGDYWRSMEQQLFAPLRTVLGNPVDSSPKEARCG